VSDDRYNGWANYPTWCVNLWASNDELLSTHAGWLARNAWEGRRATEYWTAEEQARFGLAERIKDWVTDELAPDLGASFPADLLGWALGQVDWREIADNLLAEFK
jgi:hypothetical protein